MSIETEDEATIVVTASAAGAISVAQDETPATPIPASEAEAALLDDGQICDAIVQQWQAYVASRLERPWAVSAGRSFLCSVLPRDLVRRAKAGSNSQELHRAVGMMIVCTLAMLNRSGGNMQHETIIFGAPSEEEICRPVYEGQVRLFRDALADGSLMNDAVGTGDFWDAVRMGVGAEIPRIGIEEMKSHLMTNARAELNAMRASKTAQTTCIAFGPVAPHGVYISEASQFSRPMFWNDFTQDVSDAARQHQGVWLLLAPLAVVHDIVLREPVRFLSSIAEAKQLIAGIDILSSGKIDDKRINILRSFFRE